MDYLSMGLVPMTLKRLTLIYEISYKSIYTTNPPSATYQDISWKVIYRHQNYLTI